MDKMLGLADRALRTLAGAVTSSRPYPASDSAAQLQPELSPTERGLAAALMRVNHVGEVCAQALYEAQALGTSDPALAATFQQAAAEEADHLAWTERRIGELGGRTSVLNPLWYGGAFLIGSLAARFGDRVSLGFMAETERQVEAHLAGHLERLPVDDKASRAVVAQMQADEAAHQRQAIALGGVAMPGPLRTAMRLAAKVMTTTVHRL